MWIELTPGQHTLDHSETLFGASAHVDRCFLGTAAGIKGPSCIIQSEEGQAPGTDEVAPVTADASRARY